MIMFLPWREQEMYCLTRSFVSVALLFLASLCVQASLTDALVFPKDYQGLNNIAVDRVQNYFPVPADFENCTVLASGRGKGGRSGRQHHKRKTRPPGPVSTTSGDLYTTFDAMFKKAIESDVYTQDSFK